jgi:AbrB family looped-hinge helix DNA binding protein
MSYPFLGAILYSGCRKEVLMTYTMVSAKGQIVIPAGVRARHGIRKGRRLCIEERGDEIVLRPVSAGHFRRIAGILPRKGGLAAKLLREHALDRSRE